MSALASHSPSASFYARYPRPSPKSPANRLPPTSSPALQPISSYARTPVQKPMTVDAATQYTPEGYPPTANKLAGSKRRGSSPPTPSLNHGPETTIPERPVNSDTTTSSSAPDPSLSPSLTKKPRTQPEPNVKMDSNIKIMPLRYETCDVKDLGYLISNMLMELIRLNDPIPLTGRLTRFHSRYPFHLTFTCRRALTHPTEPHLAFHVMIICSVSSSTLLFRHQSSFLLSTISTACAHFIPPSLSVPSQSIVSLSRLPLLLQRV